MSYKLVDGVVVPCKPGEYGKQQQIANWEKGDGETRVSVSTAFIPNDHGDGKGDPVCFETMILAPEMLYGLKWRYTLLDAAKRGHEIVVMLLEHRLTEIMQVVEAMWEVKKLEKGIREELLETADKSMPPICVDRGYISSLVPGVTISRSCSGGDSHLDMFVTSPNGDRRMLRPGETYTYPAAEVRLDPEPSDHTSTRLDESMVERCRHCRAKTSSGYHEPTCPVRMAKILKGEKP